MSTAKTNSNVPFSQTRNNLSMMNLGAFSGGSRPQDGQTKNVDKQGLNNAPTKETVVSAPQVPFCCIFNS